MQRHEEPPLARLRTAILAALPEFEASTFRVLNAGWDSVAIEADGCWIFKFPRHAEAIARLRKECRILSLIRPLVPVAVPDMVLHESPTLFSQHSKLAGQFLQTHDYLPLSEAQRDAIAEQMAGLYAALHAIPHAVARASGATAIDPWLSAAEVAKSAAHLPEHLRPILAETIAAYGAVPASPDETVYGYFDGHGWNMAFDPETGVLNGVYDFADSGFGPRHQDLSYSNWISRDLTVRIIGRYERMAGRSIDRDRVMLYSQMLRFVEFADTPPESSDLADRLSALRDWFDGRV